MRPERRSRLRTNLRVSVFLLADGASNLLETRTENISKHGFFCFSNRVFAPGDRARFLLELPMTGNREMESKSVYLEGIAEVRHVIVGTNNSYFGLGCHMTTYRVLTNVELCDRDEILAFLGAPRSYETLGLNSRVEQLEFSPVCPES
jgi:hypothetical protein